jgi:glutamate-1-semialdehyde 2,1-aminomutase
MSSDKTTPDNYDPTRLAAAYAKYSTSNPISAKLHQDSLACMPGGNTRTVLYANPFPLTITSASGKFLTSADGRTYTDLLGEYSAGVFGHSNPLIKEALSKTLETGWSYGAEGIPEKVLARKVTERFSKGGMDMVRFTNSGTEASTMAISTAIVYTGRKKVLVFSNAYHGATLMFPLELCRWMHSRSSDQAPWTTVNIPHDFVVAPFNNISETRDIVDALPKESLAAIIFETIQGSGGCRPALPEFVTFLRETATDLGALLIVDEVMTSRLGPSGSLATMNVKADLMTLGKWVAGGMSFGGFGGRKDIMEMYNPSRSGKGPIHPGTFNNNVFSMAAGVVALDIFNAEKVVELNRRGDPIA